MLSLRSGRSIQQQCNTSSHFRCDINSFPLDGLVRADFPTKAQCRGRFSHTDVTILRTEISIRLTILRYLDDAEPALK